MSRKSVLIFSHEPVGIQMAGPAIRYMALAEVLACEFDVVLATPKSTLPVSPLFEVREYGCHSWAQVRTWCDKADILLLSSDILVTFPDLAGVPLPLVIDGYDPHPTESLMRTAKQSFDRRLAAHNHSVDLLTRQCLAGDFFLCASETQRIWWLGLLVATGRINPYTFDEDPAVRQLLGVVPFGIPGRPLPAIPADFNIPDVEPDALVLLWGGGVWDWLDPITAIHALPYVLAQIPNVYLLFPGTRHPDANVAEMQIVEQARQAAQVLGGASTHVLFGDWVPREQWPHYLQRAAVGLSLHPDTIETHLAFRSRLMEYIWAGLPMVVSRGDETSVLVERYGLGYTVDFHAEREVAEAIVALLMRPKEVWAAGFARARADFTWENVAQPLIEFCRGPRIAPDKQTLGLALGNPYYKSEWNLLRQQYDAMLRECETLRDLVRRYESGYFMRFMRWIKRFHRR